MLKQYSRTRDASRRMSPLNFSSKKHPLAFAFPLFMACFFTPASQATIISPHTIEEMTRQADVIVHARVVEQHVRSDGERIVTETQVEVIESLKGAKTGEIKTIYQVGGTLNGMTQKIIGTHTHQIHEEMLLFAMNYRDGLISYGIGSGKYRVERSPGGELVIEDVQDVSVIRRDKEGRQTIEHHDEPYQTTLTALKTRIKRALTQPRVLPEQRQLRMLQQHPALANPKANGVKQ